MTRTFRLRLPRSTRAGLSPHLFACVALAVGIVIWALAAAAYFDVVRLELLAREQEHLRLMALWPE